MEKIIWVYTATNDRDKQGFEVVQKVEDHIEVTYYQHNSRSSKVYTGRRDVEYVKYMLQRNNVIKLEKESI